MGFRQRAENKIFSFSWYGGKLIHLDFLSEFFPRGPLYHFIDVFGGSGIVVLNCGKYRIKTYNDINSELVNFFRQIRSNGPKLHRALLLTPYSREEYIEAFKPTEDEFERARRFFIRTQMSRNGQAHQASSVDSNRRYRENQSRNQSGSTTSRNHKR